jgi:hypothetical protein
MSASAPQEDSTQARDLPDMRAECARLSAWAVDRLADPRTDAAVVAEALAACLAEMAAGQFE